MPAHLASRAAISDQGPPRLVGGRVSAPDPGLARGFSPGEVGRVRPSPDPLPALQGSPAVVRGGPPRLKTLRFVPAPWLLSPASSPPSNQASFACRQPELSFDHLSARARSVGGMVRPRAFAIFRLITNKNLVGCCTGKS